MKQILIVEDDSFLNKMLAYNLTADGYGITSVLNARAATEALRQREFDLVLLDINLPDGNGFELCKLIKPEHPNTIVIFLTANDQENHNSVRVFRIILQNPLSLEPYSEKLRPCSLCWNTTSLQKIFMTMGDCFLISRNRQLL